ncbi:MAG TPA: DUF2207 domain-containing protein, partial [Capillimicrobium sp.]
MRRAAAALAAALALILAIAPGAASARSFALPDADVQVRVARDGAIWVRESLTFAYDGAFTGAFRDIPLRSGESIDRVSVSERGERYAPGGSIALGTEGAPSQFGAGRVDDEQRIVWRYRAVNERRTFTIRYRISGLARAYDDVVDVNLQVWGDTWETGLDRLRATMAAPRPVGPANARIFGHPVSVRGDTAFADGVARLRALDIAPEQFVEMRLLFPRSMLASTARATVVPGSGRDAILADEAAAAADFEDNRRRIDDALESLPRSLLILLALSTLPAAAVLGLIWLALGRERRVRGYDREYEQEPPSDDPPALVAPLLRQSTKPGGAEFTATLFDLIRRGHVKAEPTTTDKWSWSALGRRESPDLLLTRKDAKDAATPLDAGVARILERALSNGPVALSELSDRLKVSREANAKSYRSWQSAIAKEFASRRWYDGRATTAIAVAAGALAVAAVALVVAGVVGLDRRLL